MNFLDKLFKKENFSLTKGNGNLKTTGELVAEASERKSLVDGAEIWDLAESDKNDIASMKRCCDAALASAEEMGGAPAPFYFERVAILSRKQKNYRQEIDYCKRYINVVEEFYRSQASKGCADIRQGPRYKSIVARLPKAWELLAKEGG